MAQVLVVADDLTGANAAAAGFARAGLRAATAQTVQRPGIIAEMGSRFDVVVANADCRHATPESAAERVAAAVLAGWPARLVCNRVDTTLRGNIGATTAAVLSQVRELTSSRAVVLCAPAHPAAGRHTIGGTQLLGGRRLEETEVARDARTPVSTSDVAEIIRRQAELVVSAVPLVNVTGSHTDLVEVFRTSVSGGAEVIVADATTEEHLERVAAAAVEATRGSEVVWVTTDPGPASVAMARALGLGPHQPDAPILVVSGSATALTRDQMRRLASDRGARLHRAPGRDSGPVPDVDGTAALFDELLAHAAPGEVIVVATAVDDGDLCQVTARDAAEIPRALARAVRRNLERHRVDGILATGGDVTSALLDELGSHGLAIAGEVEPLAVVGSIVGGPWDGLPVVTKGGLVGDPGTAVACVDHLRRAAAIKRHQVALAESRVST
jgi:uncharacterized protein YgbK (DUF1537 family)